MPMNEPYTIEQIKIEMNQCMPTLPKAMPCGPSVTKLDGKGWFFNTAAPIDPSLTRALDSILAPAKLTWTQAITIVNEAVAEAQVGLPRMAWKWIPGGLAYGPVDIRARWVQAKEGALRGIAALNERLKLAGATGVSFVVEEGVPKSQITNISGGGNHGMRCTSNLPTTIYLVVDSDAAVAPTAVVLQGAPAAMSSKEKLAELRELLESDLITQEEFDAEKRKILAMI